METFLVRSRYKVTYIQRAEENYAVLLAVDVEDRDKREYLFNVYENELAKKYIGCFDRLRHCPAYRGMFIDQGSLVAVFDFTGGEPIDQVFYRGAKIEWQQRLVFAQELFHLGLLLSEFPPEISCAVLLSENLRLFPLEGRVLPQYQIVPLDGMNQREAVLLLTDQIKKVLPRRFVSPDAEIRFLENLNQPPDSLVALYRCWAESKAAIEEDYHALYAKAPLQRWLYLLLKNLFRGFKRLSKGKRGR